jgi:multimeric flavodoxin WrbA
MALKVIGISASPRLNGNSDLLLRRALAGAESAGAQTEYIRLVDFKIAPCTECNSCYRTGSCIVKDDYHILSAKMLDADRLIFATPIFFMAVCAQAKALIDRCQCLWAHKYVLKKPLINTAGRDRRAMVIAVGGSKSKKMFDSIRLTMKYFFDVLDMNYAANLFVNKVEDPGRIKEHPSAMELAFRLGRNLAAADTSPPEKPVDIELV